MSGVALLQGDLAIADGAGLRGLQLLEELHDTVRAAGALIFLGAVAGARADLVSARRFMERARIATHDTGQHAALAMTLGYLAELDLEEGDLIEARRHAEEALKVATAHGHAASGGRALMSLAEIHWRLGRRNAAQQTSGEALRLIRDARRQQSLIVAALIKLGRLMGEWGDAESSLAEGLLLAREVSRRDLARGLEAVVEAAASKGQVGLALQVAGAAAALRDRMGTRPWPTERARLEAAVALARQSLNEEAADLAWMHGWTNPIDQTVAMGLDFLQDLSPESGEGHRPTRGSSGSGGSSSMSFGARRPTSVR